MGRRTWIKIYSEKWLRGSIRKEKPEVRGIWVDILTLAADSAYGDEGVISLAPGCGLTDEQICTMLNVVPEIWIKIKERLIETDRITVNGTNEIGVINWKKYQSEYARQKDYQEIYRERKKQDKTYLLKQAMATAIYQALGSLKEGRKWESLVGYTLKDLMKHLESQFQKGMSWGNYGKWHIDHKIPKSAFKYVSAEDKAFKECWSLDNLQPLWAEENLRKSNKNLQSHLTPPTYNQTYREKEKEKENNTSSPKLKFTDEDMKLVKELETLIKEVDPKHRFAGGRRREKWANTFRLMRRQDHRTIEDIRAVMEAAFGDSFWSTVIQSADGFREHYNQLRAKMLGGKGNGKKAERPAPYH